MNNVSTISTKYQIVIPKNLRRELGLKPGHKVYFKKNKDNELVVQKNTVVDEVYGSMKGAWGRDSGASIRKLRDEWDA
ncbi:MAG: AbrB/MazE/SpoVT family DNA-binding domain-containing protein [Candidatus Saccharimonadales bacterium]